MIPELAQYYEGDELVVKYDTIQMEIYLRATQELWEIETSQDLKHHSYELIKARDQIQEKYRKIGLEIDLFPLPKGTHKGEGNVAAMLLKDFLQKKGFQVLVSEEDFYLLSDRGHHYTNKGYNIINNIFGETKVKELLKATQMGGDPDIFAYLALEPKKTWFIEAKRPGEKLTQKQEVNFPLIRKYLCPVEIARLVPSSGIHKLVRTKLMTDKNKARDNRKYSITKNVADGFEIFRREWKLCGKNIKKKRGRQHFIHRPKTWNAGEGRL